jgi:hypothetical protein
MKLKVSVEDIATNLLRPAFGVERLAVDLHDEAPLPQLGDQLADFVPPNDRHAFTREHLFASPERILEGIGRVVPIEEWVLTVFLPVLLDLVAAAYD